MTLPKHPTLTFFFLMLILLDPALPRTVWAENNPVLENIKLANTRDDLLTYFNVRNAFNDKITQAIQNGIPTSFSFYISLYATSDSWFDNKIADVAIKSTIKYNSLTKEYTVNRPWKEEKPGVTQSFEKAKAWMTEIDNLKVVPLDRIEKGGKYQIRIKAEMDKVTLPLSLHYVFFFVSFWNFETDWYLINFIY